MLFRWNDWNVEHIAEHGVFPDEGWVVDHAHRPYPEARADGRRLVVGRGRGGRWLQVVYIFDPEDVVYVIHARPLREHEKSVDRGGDSDEKSRKIASKSQRRPKGIDTTVETLLGNDYRRVAGGNEGV